MKKCPYCGKEFPDDATVCPTDQQPLIALRSPGTPPPIPPPAPRRPAAPVAPARSASSPMPVIAIIAIVVAGGLFMIGLLAAIAIPNFVRARQRAMQVNCWSNLKQVGFAAQLWASDNHDQLPTNLIQLSTVLKDPNYLICIADPHRAKIPEGSYAPWDPTNVTYQFLTPGASLGAIKHKPIVRCPIHGLEVLGDGTVLDTNGVPFNDPFSTR